MDPAPVVGLFVGGRGSRFGGMAKGNLRHPTGVRLIERARSICEKALPGAPVVLVGRSEAYADLGLPTLEDSPPGIGPLGGLRALLAFAEHESRDAAVALACDLPFVTSDIVRRLASEAPAAMALAPRKEGLWYALSARYACAARAAVDTAIDASEHSLQALFARLDEGAQVLGVDERELRALADWDCPEDMAS